MSMNKQEFLARLRKGLYGLPQNDIEERLAFYGEMLDDRMEEGLSEAEAVLEMGDVDEIVRQAVADIPLTKVVRERIRPKKHLKAWEIALLAAGSPIWLSLGIAAVAIVLALYTALWAVIVSLWAVFGVFAVCAVGSVPSCVIFAAGGSAVLGFAIISVGIVCAGLSIFMFCGCKEATKYILLFTKKITIWIKNRLIGKEKT